MWYEKVRNTEALIWAGKFGVSFEIIYLVIIYFLECYKYLVCDKQIIID